MNLRNQAVIKAQDLEAPDRNFVGHRDILSRSMARYKYIEPHLKGNLLEVGCGRGYGFEKLSLGFLMVGVDISLDFLEEALFQSVASSYAQATGVSLPFPKQTFDSIVALEVIEHLEDDRKFLTELVRVADPDASFFISTPNKIIASGDVEKPLNPFHYREYTADEFTNLLKQFFGSVKLVGQMEREANKKFVNRMIDAIPIKLKYLLPINLQSRLSVVIRPPLLEEECRFETRNLNQAHTFLAICRCPFV